MKPNSVLGYALALAGLAVAVYVVGYAFKMGTEKATK